MDGVTVYRYRSFGGLLLAPVCLALAVVGAALAFSCSHNPDYKLFVAPLVIGAVIFAFAAPVGVMQYMNQRLEVGEFRITYYSGIGFTTAIDFPGIHSVKERVQSPTSGEYISSTRSSRDDMYYSYSLDIYDGVKHIVVPPYGWYTDLKRELAGRIDHSKIFYPIPNPE